MKHNIKFNANWAIRRKYSRYPICSGFGEVCFEQETVGEEDKKKLHPREWRMRQIMEYITPPEYDYTIKTAESDIVKIQQKLKEVGKLFLCVTPENRDLTIKDFFTEISYTPTEDLDRFFNVTYKRKQ